ncbi:hypothetical protein QYE76_040751 [Lolium multiflorum]|uniref:CCHC-type domain-containing protein n=1 Tax=Lolium multiflorum TaxID=4521 RepID=A0AAD8TDD4_LOLMU|nr:hypothetical protein QYE76_040751 [Lolium multiflorum]
MAPPLLRLPTPQESSILLLEVASSPPTPCPKSLANPFKLLSLDGCFHCLSTLHQVRECRDPVRCRGCGRSGHRLRECTMMFPQPTFIPTNLANATRLVSCD